MLIIFLLAILLFRFNSESLIITRGFDLLLFGLFLLVVTIKRSNVDLRVLFYFGSICIAMTISMLNGTQYVEFDLRNLFEFFRPIYYFLILVVFMDLLNKYEKFTPYGLGKIKNVAIENLFKIYLFVQLCFMLYQKFFPSGILNNYIGILYSTDKISVGLGRVVGMSGSPNTLAICITLVMFYFLSKAIFEYDSKKIALIALVNIVLVFLTTSRFVLLVLLVIYLVIFVFKLSVRFRVLVTVFLIIVFFQVVNVVTNNPYYNELIVHLVNFDFYSIPSFYNRIEHYTSILSLVKESPALAYGPNKQYSNVGDNIYIFVYFQWGWTGLLLQLFPLLFLLLVSYTNKNEQSLTLFISTFFLLSCGLVYETFYNLIYMPIYLFFIADFLLAYRRR